VNLHLEKLLPDAWKNVTREAHMISFGIDRDPDMDRIDYALFVRNDSDPCCYSTIIEIDKLSVYMQHGGAMPNVAKGVYTVRGYLMMINWLKENYSTISTRILNTNIPMIKCAMAAGLLVNGVEINDGETFLSLLWKKK
jgi:hypothetical protein